MALAAMVVPIEDACEALSVGRTTIYALMKEGQLKRVKIGRATRITMESIRTVASGEYMGADAAATNGQG